MYTILYVDIGYIENKLSILFYSYFILSFLRWKYIYG